VLSIKKAIFFHPSVRSFIFVSIGGVAYLIYAASLYSALEIFEWEMFGAVLFSYTMTIAFQFPANRYITFCDRHTGVMGEFARYIIVCTFSAIVAYSLSKWFLGLRLPRLWGYLLPFVSTATGYFLSFIFVWKVQHVR
jgi:putative flippase GtrA